MCAAPKTCGSASHRVRIRSQTSARNAISSHAGSTFRASPPASVKTRSPSANIASSTTLPPDAKAANLVKIVPPPTPPLECESFDDDNDEERGRPSFKKSQMLSHRGAGRGVTRGRGSSSRSRQRTRKSKASSRFPFQKAQVRVFRSRPRAQPSPQCLKRLPSLTHSSLSRSR
jgi:hypothetical protein